jgi:hypothetical protein
VITEGMPRKGRYIRKDSSTFKKVTIEEYRFDAVCESKIIYPDNPRSNIIFHNLHVPEVLDDEIKKTELLTQNLQDVNQWSPVIRPKDFTTSWRAAKDKKRTMESFEEEEEEELDNQVVSSSENVASTAKPEELVQHEVFEEKIAPFKFKEMPEVQKDLGMTGVSPGSEKSLGMVDPAMVAALEVISLESHSVPSDAMLEVERTALLENGVAEGLRLAAEKYSTEQAATRYFKIKKNSFIICRKILCI